MIASRHDIGMMAVSTLNASKQGLLLAIVRRNVSTFGIRTSLRTIAGIRPPHDAPTPGLFVFQHPAKSVPALIENRLVEASFRTYLATRIFDRASCRLGHITNSQVLEIDRRVVFADVGRKLVEEILPTVGDSDMQVGNFLRLISPP
jgi:hypothetical protein